MIVLSDNPKYQTNQQLLEEIIMHETLELRTPHNSECICMNCQKEKYQFCQRLIPKITRYFKRKN
jgi:hypothetical protein